MKAVLINKTDDGGHHGCTLVNRQIDVLASAAGIEIVAKLPLHSDWDTLAPDRFEAVLVNGEGTLHSSSKGARRIAEAPTWAEARDIPAHLINSVYQDNDDAIAAAVARFNTITVRDNRSASELARHGVEAAVVPDLSLTWQTDPAPARGKTIINGSVIESVRRDLYALSSRERPYLPMMARPLGGKRRRNYHLNRTLSLLRAPGLKRARRRNSIARFEPFIDHLRRNAGAIITGRYHMATIALCLEIPVIAMPSNTHKIEALFDNLDMAPRVGLPGDLFVPPYSPGEIARIRAFRHNAGVKAHALFARIASLVEAKRPSALQPESQD